MTGDSPCCLRIGVGGNRCRRDAVRRGAKDDWRDGRVLASALRSDTHDDLVEKVLAEPDRAVPLSPASGTRPTRRLSRCGIGRG